MTVASVARGLDTALRQRFRSWAHIGRVGNVGNRPRITDAAQKSLRTR